MDMDDCLELERRLAIGFNDYLSLEKRRQLIYEEKSLKELLREDERFRSYTRETRDVLHWLSRSRENSVIWYGDRDFPSFRPLRNRLPYMLFCQGTRPDPSLSCSVIVGTRHATYRALHQAFRFGLEAVENSMLVASGMAEGVDQSGMTGAIEGGGPCMGVLACGHDVEYPSLTLTLRRRIIDGGGCILSRFAPSEAAYKSNFLSRNMVLAAYGSFTVAVQAPGKSGTLNTCGYSLQMGKDVYVGSEGVGDRFVQAGTTGLFNDGAKVLKSLADVDYPYLKMRFFVSEMPSGLGLDFEKNYANSGSTTRFGDKMYMVRELIS
ncbi:MAG: DNA-processing protein DprA [Sphaerochaeta sp.]